MAEVIQTADTYVWRETAPATYEGYVTLLALFFDALHAVDPNKWGIRVVPEIQRGEDWSGNAWYECRFRLASITSYQDWNKRGC